MIFQFFRRWTLKNGNTVLQDYGSSTEPQLEATVDGSPRQGPTTVTLAAGESKLLWSYTTDGDFEKFLIEADGACDIAQKVDAPTSTSDNTASGTAVNYPKERISCNMPYTIQGMTLKVHASASNYAASAFHASVAEGRRYEIWAKNPSDTDEIELTYLWTL